MFQNKKVNEYTPKQICLFLLQFAAFFLLLGRGLQHAFFSTPYSAFFTHETYMLPIIDWFSDLAWWQYLRDETWNENINTFIRTIGWGYILSAIIVLFFQKIPKRGAQFFVGILTAFLLFLAFCYYIGQANRSGQFWEYSSQFSLPILLYWARFGNPLKANYLLILKIVIALTFTCHGLYAIGYYPVPGYFVDMIVRGLGVAPDTARQLLYTAGILDFILSVLIFLPFRFLVIPALVWAIIWGLITTGARLFTNIYWDIFWDTIWRGMPDMLMRFPHFILPTIALYLVLFSNFKKLQGVRE